MMAMSSETYESSIRSDVRVWGRARCKREKVVGCYLLVLHFRRARRVFIDTATAAL